MIELKENGIPSGDAGYTISATIAIQAANNLAPVISLTLMTRIGTHLNGILLSTSTKPQKKNNNKFQELALINTKK